MWVKNTAFSVLFSNKKSQILFLRDKTVEEFRLKFLICSSHLGSFKFHAHQDLGSCLFWIKRYGFRTFWSIKIYHTLFEASRLWKNGLVTRTVMPRFWVPRPDSSTDKDRLGKSMIPTKSLQTLQSLHFCNLGCIWKDSRQLWELFWKYANYFSNVFTHFSEIVFSICLYSLGMRLPFEFVDSPHVSFQ